MSDIGTLNEGSLHAAMKMHYAEPGDRFEVPIGGFVIDIVRDGSPPMLVEIQTQSFASMGRKLDHLLEDHRILLVHPVAVSTVLHRPDKRPRRSPKKGTIHNVFDELVSMPTLLDHPHLELDVALVDVARHEQFDRRARRGRGGYRTTDRGLLGVRETHRLATTDDLRTLLPSELPPLFTTADLAESIGIRRDLAQRMAYCLRALEILTVEGRGRDGMRYAVAD